MRTLPKPSLRFPAYFNDSQRQATKDAGLIAGLEVLRIINEPTAAALAYGLQKNTQGLVAVYDLGGGTFDISILKLKDGIFEVLATNGNTHLGGDDFDRRLVDAVIRDIDARHGVKVEDSLELMQTVRLEAEKTKIRLSDEPQAHMAFSLPDGKGTYERTWSRDEFEALIRGPGRTNHGSLPPRVERRGLGDRSNRRKWSWSAAAPGCR